ncbi:MAG: phytanoyl-CoA dioxygenase family protein [Candidatus Latescibacterota bacterium]|jgi:ectoine hydroxylase-related dioxygenase (phytanoyl-CoA dioxygenase family)|nr:phytanoyl-CoA dioxygenase family protein [Candidatus Latescibacterota bacterium]
MPSIESAPAFELTAEQKYEFDLQGYIVLKEHYDAAAVETLHAGIDELQAIPIDYETYTKIGVASYYLAAAMQDPEHPFWRGDHRLDRRLNPKTGGVGRVDHALCGTDKFDLIVRDSVLKAIHTTFAGGPVFVSASYYIEKIGPCPGGGLHNGGYPLDRDIYYAYDHTNQRFACSSTKSVVILSDMTQVENGPFAAIPGSHKANFSCPHDMSDASKNPMAVPVLAAPGDVVIFSEGMTHNAYPVSNDSIRRSIFFNYMPSIGRNNLPLQRMSIYPDHVLERLSDHLDVLTSPGYI